MKSPWKTWSAFFRKREDIASIPSERIIGNVAIPAIHLNRQHRPIERIAVFKLDHLGDFFVSIRAMERLRDAWPEAHITLVCGPWNRPFAERLEIFDRIVTYNFFKDKSAEEDFKWEEQDWEKRCDGIRDLGLGAFDLAIDLRHDYDTRPCLLRIESTYRAGFTPSRGGQVPLDLALIEFPPKLHEQLHAETRLNALASLVVESLVPPKTHPIRRLVSPIEKEALPFEGKRAYMVVAPGAGSPNRTWSPDNFVQLMARAHQEWGIASVLIGGASEAPVNARIASHFSSQHCSDLTGSKLAELPTLIAHASLYIGNDTGGSHLAAGLGIPTLSIYGGVSDPRVWQPLGPQVTIVHSRTPCSYCHKNLRKDCRYAVRCMTEITVEDAYAALQDLYKRQA